MSSDEIRLWRDSLGSFVRDSVFGQATHIALPAAKHAALMRVVEAARALLDLLAYEHPDFGYSEIADLRAALAAPEPASAEAVAWWRLCVGRGEWLRDDGVTRLAVRVHDGADLSCQATRQDAMQHAVAHALRAGKGAT